MGNLAGMIAKTALPQHPLMEEEVEVEAFDCGLSTKSIADVLAGFTFGFTGHDDRAYLEQCIKDTPQFEADMCAAANAFATKDTQQATAAVHTILADMPFIHTMYVTDCPAIAADTAYP